MSDRPAPKEKPEIVALFARQIADKGSIDWPPIYEKYPHISRSTMFRWAQLVRSGEPSLTDLNAAVKKIETAVVTRTVLDALPTIPTPRTVAQDPEGTMHAVDYAHQMTRLWQDAEKLRSFAIKPVSTDEDPDGYKIKNPVQFEKSMKLRISLIETSIDTLQDLWGMRDMQVFYEAMLDEIGKESPECQARIGERMLALSRRRGMSLNAMRV